jgi:hypothetical protein
MSRTFACFSTANSAMAMALGMISTEPPRATITGKPRPAPLRSLARTSSSSSRALLLHDLKA